MTPFDVGVAEGMNKHASAASEAAKDAPGLLSRAAQHLKNIPARAGAGAMELGFMASNPMRTARFMKDLDPEDAKELAINIGHAAGVGGLGATGVYALGKRSGRREQG
jgi:hypothetical protein